MWTVTHPVTPGPAGELQRAACREARLPQNAAGRQSLASSPGGRWVRAGSKEVGSAPPSLSLPPVPRVHGPLHLALPLPPDPLPPEAIPGPHTVPRAASPLPCPGGTASVPPNIALSLTSAGLPGLPLLHQSPHSSALSPLPVDVLTGSSPPPQPASHPPLGWLISRVNMARLRCPEVWSNTSPGVSVKGFCRCH